MNWYMGSVEKRKVGREGKNGKEDRERKTKKCLYLSLSD